VTVKLPGSSVADRGWGTTLTGDKDAAGGSGAVRQAETTISPARSQRQIASVFFIVIFSSDRKGMAKWNL